VQKTRTELDFKRAATDVIINLQAFYGKPFGPLDENTAKKMEPFFEKLRNETNYFTQKLKKDFPRTRPFEYIAGLEPCVLREHSLSYPSGHAAIAELFALTLDDLYPKQKSEFDHRAQQIGDDRVVAGMHHPSDVAAGRKFADLLYAEIKKSPAFQADLKEAQQK
jgi:acid phosphatase (class A)